MQQTVRNVHKEMDKIGVMESVNGKLTNVNSNKVLITKKIMDNPSYSSKFHFSKEHKNVQYDMNFYCLKVWDNLTFISISKKL